MNLRRFLLNFACPGFIKGAESIPVLLGVPLTAYLNDASNRYGRAGYFLCAAVAAISAILMFFVGHPTNGRQNLSKYSTNGSITSHCTLPTSECPDLLNRSFSSNNRYGNWYRQQAPYTTMTTNGGCSAVANGGHHHSHGNCSNTPSHHHHQHHHHNQYLNGGGGGSYHHTSHCPNGGVANGLSTGNGRLQKSLSFAFQNPAMWNDSYHHSSAHAYSNGGGAPNYATYRPHSRYI